MTNNAQNKSRIKIIVPDADSTEAMLKIERKCFGLNAWSRDGIYHFICDEYSHTLCAATEDGAIIGYAGASVICGEAEITNVAVLPEYRRLGAGRLMMTALETRFAALGVMLALLEVRSKNLPAIGLYTSLGYSEYGRRRSYYTFPRDDAILMKKTFEMKEVLARI